MPDNVDHNAQLMQHRDLQMAKSWPIRGRNVYAEENTISTLFERSAIIPRSLHNIIIF